jgi:hypothetical protein
MKLIADVTISFDHFIRTTHANTFPRTRERCSEADPSDLF